MGKEETQKLHTDPGLVSGGSGRNSQKGPNRGLEGKNNSAQRREQHWKELGDASGTDRRTGETCLSAQPRARTAGHHACSFTPMWLSSHGQESGI